MLTEIEDADDARLGFRLVDLWGFLPGFRTGGGSSHGPILPLLRSGHRRRPIDRRSGRLADDLAQVAAEIADPAVSPLPVGPVVECQVHRQCARLAPGDRKSTRLNSSH